MTFRYSLNPGVIFFRSVGRATNTTARQLHELHFDKKPVQFTRKAESVCNVFTVSQTKFTKSATTFFLYGLSQTIHVTVLKLMQSS